MRAGCHHHISGGYPISTRSVLQINSSDVIGIWSFRMNAKQVSIAALLAITSFSASAASPHFIKGPTATGINNDGDYVVTFKEAGLGNTPITYSLTADENFTFQCFNPANNTPQGDPNGVSISDASTFVTIQPRNGQITGSISLTPETDGANCQGKAMKLCLVAVSYTNVVFNETTTPLGPFNLPSLSRDFSRNPICGF